jgi:virulence-associated protein VapD
MSRDTSCRPHEVLKLKIKDIRWVLERHPFKNNPNSPVFVSFTKKSKGTKQLGINNGAGRIYWEYQHLRVVKVLHMCSLKKLKSAEGSVNDELRLFLQLNNTHRSHIILV